MRSHSYDTRCAASSVSKGIVVVLCAVVVGSYPTTSFGETPNTVWNQFRGPDRTGVSSSIGLLSSWSEDGPPLEWQTDGAGRGYSSVSISDGKLFTLGDAPSTADDEDEYLLCFDLRSGKQIWKARLGEAWSEGPPDWQSSRSTPTIDGGRIYSLTAHGDLICSATGDGREIWRKNLREDFEGNKGDGWGYSESVLIDGDRLICTPGGEQNTVVALDKANGELDLVGITRRGSWSGSCLDCYQRNRRDARLRPDNCQRRSGCPRRRWAVDVELRDRRNDGRDTDTHRSRRPGVLLGGLWPWRSLATSSSGRESSRQDRRSLSAQQEATEQTRWHRAGWR